MQSCVHQTAKRFVKPIGLSWPQETFLENEDDDIYLHENNTPGWMIHLGPFYLPSVHMFP